jgi:RimJ/RimL family protein N-acetyltransferase
MNPPVLPPSTERLLIRQWGIDDAARMYDIHRRPEIVRWFGTPVAMSGPMEAYQRIEKYRSYDPPFGCWAAEERATGKVVGTVLLMPGRADGHVEIGWYLHPDSTGNGFATEGSAAVLEHAWAAGHRSVVANTDVDNYPSHAVALRLGMTEVGIANADSDRPTRVFRISRSTCPR